MTKIILADDDPGIRFPVAGCLRGAGYETYEAKDGLEAVELQRTVHADILLTDILMPRQNGIKTITQFKKEFPYVRIIALSGGGRTEGVDELVAARNAGADVVLFKGTMVNTLIEGFGAVKKAIVKLTKTKK